MIDAIAKRRVTVNGTTYQKGEIIPMPLMQFKDLEPTGFVGRAPRRRVAARSIPKSTSSAPAD